MLELPVGDLVRARLAFRQADLLVANRSAFGAYEHCPHQHVYKFDLRGELEIAAVGAPPGQAPRYIARGVNREPA